MLPLSSGFVRTSDDGGVGSVDPCNSGAIDALAEKHKAFHESSLEERVALASEVLLALAADEWSTAGNWVAEATAVDRMPPAADPETKNVGAAARFVLGSCVKSYCATFVTAAAAASSSSSSSLTLPGGSAPRKAGRFTVHGPVVVGMSAPGLSFELYSDAESFSPTDDAVAAFREKSPPGTCSVVLGAGNQCFLSLVDVLDRVLAHSECVLLKHHPLRPFLLAPYGIILEPLLKRGLLRMVLDEGVAATTALLRHPKVGHVHVTGSEQTFKAIGKAVAAAGNETCGVTGELGCATPWIALPGRWSDKELANAAKLLATAKKANGGCNCLSAQVLVVPRDWEQKGALVAAVQEQLAALRTFPCYYTGGYERKEAMLKAAAKTQAQRRIAGKNRVPTTTEADDVVVVEAGVVGKNGRLADNSLTTNEAFCPLLAIVEVPGGSSASDDYVQRACAWANSDDICGSLSCSVLAPASASAAAVDAAAAALDFGTVAVNTWSVFGYTCATLGATWGAHPADKHFRSGRGRIGNHFGIPDVVKTVLKASPLEKPELDLSTPPPTVVFDLLHQLAVRSSGYISGFRNLATFLFMRTAQLFYVGAAGRRYGAAI